MWRGGRTHLSFGYQTFLNNLRIFPTQCFQPWAKCQNLFLCIIIFEAFNNRPAQLPLLPPLNQYIYINISPDPIESRLTTEQVKFNLASNFTALGRSTTNQQLQVVDVAWRTNHFFYTSSTLCFLGFSELFFPGPSFAF